MRFPMPHYPSEFEIPDDWLREAGVIGFTPLTTSYHSTALSRCHAKIALAAQDGGDTIAAEVGRRLAALRSARSFVDWQQRRDFVKGLDLQRTMIVDRVAQTRADLALDLLWRFMDLAEPVLNRVDDSNGSVGDVFRTACQDLGVITVIPAVTIPLALLGACALMWAVGYSLDNLSLMAFTIAVGFVVDDAIVMLENITRHVEEGERPFEAALKGSRLSHWLSGGSGNALERNSDQPVSYPQAAK